MTSPSAGILVLGAGELGLAVLDALLAQPSRERVSVFLRQPTSASSRQTAADLAARGIPIVRGDIANQSVSELAAAFAGFSTVICCTGFVGGAGTQLKITEAVLLAQVARYVPWQFGVDYDVIGKGSGQAVFDEQVDVRARLRSQSTTSWVIISTGVFTDFLFEPAFGVVDLQGGAVRALGTWDYRLTVTTAEDIGRLTARILAQQPPFRDEVVYVAGETISYARLADKVEAHLGRPVSRTLWTVDHLRAEADAHPEDGMRAYHLAFARADGVAWDEDKTFNRMQGVAVTDVSTWLQRAALHSRRPSGSS